MLTSFYADTRLHIGPTRIAGAMDFIASAFKVKAAAQLDDRVHSDT